MIFFVWLMNTRLMQLSIIVCYFAGFIPKRAICLNKLCRRKASPFMLNVLIGRKIWNRVRFT